MCGRVIDHGRARQYEELKVVAKPQSASLQSIITCSNSGFDAIHHSSQAFCLRHKSSKDAGVRFCMVKQSKVFSGPKLISKLTVQYSTKYEARIYANTVQPPKVDEGLCSQFL